MSAKQIAAQLGSEEISQSLTPRPAHHTGLLAEQNPPGTDRESLSEQQLHTVPCTVGPVQGRGSLCIPTMPRANESNMSMLLMGNVGSQSSMSESKVPAFENGVGPILLNPSNAEGCRCTGLGACS